MRLPWWFAGFFALLLILLLAGLPLLAIALEAGQINLSGVLGDAYTQRVIRFSIIQAALSTLLSLGLAIPVALALSHEPRFPGRSILITLFSLSLVIPTVVAIFGIVAVYGRTGWFNAFLSALSIDPLSLYGLNGILLAHVFFNMPFATRVLLQNLDGIPGEQWRLATQLGMPYRSRFRHIEWPALRQSIPGLSALIFALCFTSFAIVMTLGGGPRATTIEVAIYQALRFDFDLNMAVTLAGIQLVLCTVLMVLSTLLARDIDSTIGFSGLLKPVSWRPTNTHRWLGILTISLATAFVLLPLLGLLFATVNTKFLTVIKDSLTLLAIGNTLVTALVSAFLSVALALGLLFSARHLRIRMHHERAGVWLQMAGNIILVLPPLVLGTGLFLLLQPFADVFSLALVLVIAINCLTALPFVVRMLEAPMMQASRQHDRLLMSLGIRSWHRWHIIDWPLLRRPIGLALAVAATLSAGDLTAIALFGSERFVTLPLLLYQRMGSYRLEEAAVTAGILLALCLFLFASLQRIIGGRAHA